VVVSPGKRLREILKVGQLVTLRSIGEIARKLRQLVSQRRVPAGLSRLGRGVEVRGNLLRHVLILSGILLLQILQSGGDLRERRELIGVLRRGGAGCGSTGDSKGLAQNGLNEITVDTRQ